jgi:leucyl aminopeptidase
MKIRLLNQNITAVAADALIVNLFEGVSAPGGATGAVDQATNGLITRLINQGEFTGKLNEVAVLYPSEISAKKVIVVGLGKSDSLTIEKLRQVMGSALKAAAKGKVATDKDFRTGYSYKVMIEDATFTAGTK